MVTIHHLEVQITAEAFDEDTAFSRQFKTHIERWQRMQEEALARRAELEAERRIGRIEK